MMMVFAVGISIPVSMIENIRATDVFRELELLHKTGIENINPEDISKSIRGRSSINHFLKNMLFNAKKSVMIATTAEGIRRKASLLRNILAALSKRKVRISIFAPHDEKTAEKIKFAKLKNVDPKARLVLIDKEEVLFMFSDDSVNPDYDTAVWIKSPYFVGALEQLVENNL